VRDIVGRYLNPPDHALVLGLLVIRHALQDRRQDLPRLGKRRLAVRIVGAPHHVVDADDVAQANADRVLLEA
jgi:hypothetical protein